jgi:hypothetical protein
LWKIGLVQNLPTRGVHHVATWARQAISKTASSITLVSPGTYLRYFQPRCALAEIAFGDSLAQPLAHFP